MTVNQRNKPVENRELITYTKVS